VSWRLSRKLATSAERTIDPAQPMTTHGHTGVCECPTGQGGVLIGMPAKAVSMGSHPLRILLPHGPVRDCALTGAGIVEGAKKSIAPINAVLTILRSFIILPPSLIFRSSFNSYCPHSLPKRRARLLLASKFADHQPFARVAAGLVWYGIGIQYNKPQVHASGVVSWRLSRKLATRAERTIDPAQPMTTQGHAGVCECPTGHGAVLIDGPAKALSMGSQATGAITVPQGGTAAALTALRGTIDGAKKNMAPIKMVLTI
jgi:hypothetical protein